MLPRIETAIPSDGLAYTDTATLLNELKAISWKGKNLLMMTSGNFDGLDYVQLAGELR